MNYLKFTNIKNYTIDSFIRSFHVGKAIVYQIEQSHSIKVNNLEVSPDYFIQDDDIITIDLDLFEENTTQPWEYSLDIIYEDDDILIVNKPTNMLVHPDGNDNKTMANAVSFYYNKKHLNRQVRHVHRLDNDTSGLLVYAKHFLAHSFLNYQIENNLFKKTYLAIVEGKMEQQNGVIDLKIGRNRHISNQYLVSESGKDALTKYQVMKYGKNKCLLKVEIETGRTHQIRVHLSHIHHPIIGDSIYGKKGIRLMLHSYQVSFIHPRTKEVVTFNTKFPKGFNIEEGIL